MMLLHNIRSRLNISDAWWLILESVKKQKVMLSVLLAIGVVIGLIEGAVIGLISYAVIIVTSESPSCHHIMEFTLSLVGSNQCEPFQKYNIFIWLILFSIFIQLAKAIFTYLSGYLGTVLKTRVGFHVRTKVIEHFFALGYEETSAFPLGEKTLIAANSIRVASLVVVVNSIVVTLSVLVVYLLIMLKMNLELTMFSFILLAGVFLGINPLLTKVRAIANHQKWLGINLGKNVSDYLIASRLVKLYGNDKKVSESLKMIYRQEVGLARESAKWGGILQPLQETVIVISAATVILFSFFYNSSEMSTVLPQTLAFVLVMQRAGVRAIGLNSIRTNFAATMVHIEHITDFLKIPLRKEARGSISIPENWKKLVVDDLSFQYAGSSEVVIKGMDFVVNRGESIAFVGPSGAGKSTVLDLVTGLLLPTSGSIKLGDVNMVDVAQKNWADQFSMVSQNDFILNNNVIHNVMFSDDSASFEDVVDACKVAHAHDFIMKLEGGYEAQLGELGAKLSGGQIQRIAFARAVLAKSPILLLDEATSALDSLTEKILSESVDLYKEQGGTVIMVAHRLSTIIGCDKIFVLDNGNIIDSGNHKELLKKSDLYRKMWELQGGLENA